jgi:hypothetical protein
MTPTPDPSASMPASGGGEAGLYSLAYFSRNLILGSPDRVQAEIEHILLSARRANAANGVSGALLFSDGCFAQVLEGPRDAVEATFESIQCDARHADVTILHLHAVGQRSFADWAMAFGGIDGVSTDPRLGDRGMSTTDGIMASEAGQNLLRALRSVVHRDDLALRDEMANRA